VKPSTRRRSLDYPKRAGKPGAEVGDEGVLEQADDLGRPRGTAVGGARALEGGPGQGAAAHHGEDRGEDCF
jgi:hypothetical protein